MSRDPLDHWYAYEQKFGWASKLELCPACAALLQLAEDATRAGRANGTGGQQVTERFARIPISFMHHIYRESFFGIRSHCGNVMEAAETKEQQEFLTRLSKVFKSRFEAEALMTRAEDDTRSEDGIEDDG